MDRLLDQQGLADYLGVSFETVREWVKKGLIPFTRMPGGRQVRFASHHVAAIVAAGEQPAINGPLARPQLQSVPTTSEELAA